MKSAPKRGRRGAGVLRAVGPPVIGGVTPGSTRRPPDSSRTSAGRLGRTLAATSKKSTPRAAAKGSAAKALERSENEGGKAQRSPAATTSAPKRPVKRVTPKIERSAFLAPVPPDLGRQRRAQARAKGSQIKQAGVESRLLGHISGSGKRNQARRDSKNG